MKEIIGSILYYVCKLLTFSESIKVLLVHKSRF